MSPIEPNSLEQAQLLYQALTLKRTQLSTSAEALIDALRSGAARILVEVPWREVRGGEVHDRHQIILTRLEGRRIYFINALKSSLPEGSEIEGSGPTRRVEAHGEESMDLVRFVALFASGGKALIQA